MATEQLIPLAQPALGELGHACAFFHSKDEEYRVLMSFIKDGFARGDRAFHIVDPKLREDHLRRLRLAGIDVAAAEQRKQLEVRNWEDAYLRGGHFDQDAMMALLEEILQSGLALGFALTRILAHMEWALEDRPGVDDFLEYEARVNYLLQKNASLTVCVYDCAKFDAGVMMDVLRTHPMVIVGGVLQRNPFFVPPDEFLAELRKRAPGKRGFREGVTANNRQLRQTIRDLMALSGIPVAWIGEEPEQIAKDMAFLLMSALRLAVAHVCLKRPDGTAVEVSRAEQWPEFSNWLKGLEGPPRSANGMAIQSRVELPTDRGSLYTLVVPIQMDAEAGWMAVGAQRPEFPTEMERLLLSVAANQALVLFQNACVFHEQKRTEQHLQVLREEIDRTSMFEEIVGASPALHEVLTRVAKVAPTDTTVLLLGETGTGKELIARAIHQRSPRSAQAFVNVNCAALPPTLIASELFGHEKGSFTGAHQRRLGRFELADGGTIFLDEIGDLPAETQIALLRVLQDREFERVGGSQPIKIDVRVIAATNRNLKAAIAAGTFRTDLFYRLNVFPIEVPPLRERKEDIPILVQFFVERYASKVGKKIRAVDQRTLELFQSYHWPGNIRQLQNVIERHVILCESDILSVDEAWLSTRESAPQPPGLLMEKLLNQEREIIESALAQSKGRVAGPSGAAAKLGIPPSTLESRIRALKVSKNRFRPN